jgi:hypothetical protein
VGTLMFKCPKTGREVSTGIQMDRSTPQNMPVFFTRTPRPIRETGHEWFAKAAWILEPKGRGVRPIDLARIDRRRPTAAMDKSKWIVAAAIFAAVAVAAGFVAGTAAVDASPVSNGAIRSTGSSTVVVKSTAHAIAFPEINRAAKGNRLHVSVAENEVGAAIEQATREWESRSAQSRVPRQGGRKPVMHCEPVGSLLAGPAVLYMPPRRCLARLGPLTRYALADITVVLERAAA